MFIYKKVFNKAPPKSIKQPRPLTEIKVPGIQLFVDSIRKAADPDPASRDCRRKAAGLYPEHPVAAERDNTPSKDFVKA